MDPSKRESLAKTFTMARDAAQKRGLQTFIGFTPPSEVEQLATILSSGKDFDKASFRKIIRFVVEYMKGTDITDEHWARLKESLGIDESILSTAFAGALTIIKKATRNRVPPEIIKRDCTETLKIPLEYVEDISQVIQNWKENIEASVRKETKLADPTVVNMRWRVDVMIMSSHTERIFKPMILTQLTDSNGKIHTFEMSVHNFQNLRHQMEKLKDEMLALESTPILQIDKPK